MKTRDITNTNTIVQIFFHKQDTRMLFEQICWDPTGPRVPSILSINLDADVRKVCRACIYLLFLLIPLNHVQRHTNKESYPCLMKTNGDRLRSDPWLMCSDWLDNVVCSSFSPWRCSGRSSGTLAVVKLIVSAVMNSECITWMLGQENNFWLLANCRRGSNFYKKTLTTRAHLTILA